MYKPVRTIVQGITGQHGRFHTAAMRRYGTEIIGGVSPGRLGQQVDDVQVYDTINQLQGEVGQVDASVIFVPAPHAKAAILEAIEAQIKLIVCITEGIPIYDMLEVKQRLKASASRLVGPNCPGILVPGSHLLGITPTDNARPGSVAVVSRSGTLTYEAIAELSRAGFGQRVVVGIGGDLVSGTSFTDCLEQFYADPAVSSIVMIGEIGGQAEYDAANHHAAHGTKPVTAYIAGHAAPAGVQMGHAGAILGSQSESAQAKTAYLMDHGITTVNTITDIVTRGNVV